MTKEEAIAYAAYHLDQIILALHNTDKDARFARAYVLEREKDFLLTAMAALEEVENDPA